MRGLEKEGEGAKVRVEVWWREREREMEWLGGCGLWNLILLRRSIIALPRACQIEGNIANP